MPAVTLSRHRRAVNAVVDARESDASPRLRGEAAGRKPAGEGSSAADHARTPFTLTLSPLRGARANGFSGALFAFGRPTDDRSRQRQSDAQRAATDRQAVPAASCEASHCLALS